MSVLYCTIPHFVAGLARRDRPDLGEQPLILVGPQKRVVGVSAEAAAWGVAPGMATRAAEVRCPEAHLMEADMACCRAEAETLLQVLEMTGPRVEAHGWGAAYADLGDLARGDGALPLLREIGRAVRRELGETLQPALGWDSTKFTAQAAARRTSPGRMRAVENAQQRAFLRPLPVTLLPLPGDVLQRLRFLGLRTLGQYGALPAAAVWQQFGRAGKLAYRCARGEDDRPVVPRTQPPHLEAGIGFEAPLAERARLVATLEHLVSPLLVELRANLQACGRLRLAVQFEDGSSRESERAFLFPVAQEGHVVRALIRLSDSQDWPARASGLRVTLEEIQDAAVEQLPLFALEPEAETKIDQVGRYLVTRFGTNRLRRAVLAQPGAPLPEWRWHRGAP